MKKTRSIKSITASAAAVLFWIMVWQIGAFFANKSLILKIPMPLDVAKALLIDLSKRSFWAAVGTSVFHILSGYLAAVLVGMILGLLSEISAFFRHLFSPLMHTVRAVPVASFIFIAWLWVPSSVLPGIIAFLIVVPIICSHIEAGFTTEQKQFAEAAQVSGAKKRDVLLKIRMPLLLPHFRSGCITGLGIAWKAGVAAEVICSPTGSIGSLLKIGKASIDYDEVFAVTIMVILLSILFESILKILWKEKQQ